MVAALAMVGAFGSGVANADDVPPTVTLTKTVDGVAAKDIGPGDSFTYSICCRV